MGKKFGIQTILTGALIAGVCQASAWAGESSCSDPGFAATVQAIQQLKQEAVDSQAQDEESGYLTSLDDHYQHLRAQYLDSESPGGQKAIDQLEREDDQKLNSKDMLLALSSLSADDPDWVIVIQGELDGLVAAMKADTQEFKRAQDLLSKAVDGQTAKVSETRTPSRLMGLKLADLKRKEARASAAIREKKISYLGSLMPQIQNRCREIDEMRTAMARMDGSNNPILESTALYLDGSALKSLDFTH